MEPISSALAGIALVQKSVEFVKSNINTMNDVKDILGVIDNVFEGEKQIQRERFGNKSIIGQTKDAASSVIDAKIAREQMEELQILVDNRFGYGTWREIVNERAKRLQEEKEAEREAKLLKMKKRKEMLDTVSFFVYVVAGILATVLVGGLGFAIWQAQ
jgi:nitrate reductase NapE component